MVAVATFELAQVERAQRDELLGHLSKLLMIEQAEFQSKQDITEGSYEFVMKVPVTNENQEMINALTALSTDAAL